MKFLKTMGMINNLAIGRGFLGPNSCAISSDGRIFVLDYYLYPEKTARITVQTFEEEFLFEFATLQGSNPGDKLLKIPSDLEFDSKDRLYVTDEGLNAVIVYDSSGNYCGDIGQNEGQFNGTSGIAIDSKGHLFIVDQYNHRIQKFTNEGEFLNSFLNGIDLFAFWRVYIMTIGLSFLYGKTTKTSLIAMGALWLFGLIFFSGLGAFFAGFSN